jgi:crossover junction endodeoxyribonuclease RuvC
MARVVSFDLSLTATGWCEMDATFSAKHGTISPGKLTGMARLQYILAAVINRCRGADMIVFEDLSFGSNMPGASERTGLAYLIRYSLWARKQRFVLVAPKALKKFVTGSGIAEKNTCMLHVFRRFGISATNDHEADAVGLAFIGRALLGDWECQIDAQREVLAKVRAAAA